MDSDHEFSPPDMLAKTESRREVETLEGFSVIALIESPRAVVNVEDIAEAENLAGLMWGAEDLIAGLGGRRSRTSDGRYYPLCEQVRASVLLHAKSHGRFAWDAVFMDIPDVDGLRAETIEAVDLGFDGKVAIHPTQVQTIQAAFRPSEHEVAWAKGLLAAAANERGVFRYEGRMVDGPILKQAQSILRRIQS